jgi:molybdopterin/thiamine biosynthesis adenylyltransferase
MADPLQGNRFERHEMIPDWSQATLACAKVVVMGCGALGNEVLKNLALLGVGNVWIVDYDTIEIHNLTRSVLFREDDVGRLKAEVAAERLREIYPDMSVTPVIGKLEYSFGRGLLRNMDVVIGCLDSIEARQLLNQRCYFAGVPWVDGGIDDSVGNVALYNPRHSETACYRCQMTKSHWAAIKNKYSCGVLRSGYTDPKIATTAMTASVTGAYQTQLAIQVILNKQGLDAGKLLLLPVSPPLGFMNISLAIDKKCPDHRNYLLAQNLVPTEVSLDSNPSAIANSLELGEDWVLELPFDFISDINCKCGYKKEINLPMREVSQEQVICPTCGNRTELNSYFKIQSNSNDANRPFQEFFLYQHEILYYVSQGKRISIELIQTVNAQI